MRSALPRAELALALVGLLALGAPGCGNPSTETVIVSGPAIASGGQVAAGPGQGQGPAPFCSYEGTWGSGVLRAMQGGFPAVGFHEVPARVQIDRVDGPLRMHAEIRAAGWTFLGYQDLGSDHPLRARERIELAEGLVLQPGAFVAVLDARPSSLLLGPALDEGFRLLARPERGFPCEALTLFMGDEGLRTEERDRQERQAMGLPADPPRVLLPAGSTAALAPAPGQPPFAELSAGEHPRSLFLLERAGEHSRVLLHHWDGTMVIGWVPSASVRAATGPEEAGILGALGGLGGEREIQVCQSPERLPIFAVQEGSEPAPIGILDAGAPFVLVGQREDGLLVLASTPGSGVHLPSGEVAWISRASVAPRCETRRYDPNEMLRNLIMGPPAHHLRLRATITALRGLGGVGVGGQCEGELLVRTRESLGCRLELRCGGHRVYGSRPTNGFFNCEVGQGAGGQPNAPPPVRGQDTNTSEADGAAGDPAMSIDTGAGRLTVEDDASGSMGALRIEARIDSVTPASP